MSLSKPVQTISFSEIIKNTHATVRVTDDGLLYAVDLTMVVTGKNQNDAGHVIRNLGEENFQSVNFIKRQISSHGGYKTKLVSFEHAIELIMVLPGKMAKQVRKQMKDIIVRYLDGDTSMCSEIQANREMGKVNSYARFASKAVNNVKTEIPQAGYVYATKSQAFPGLIKIGKTINVSNRLSQLNTSCAPAPHVIVAVAPSFDEDRDEKTAHAFFATSRRQGEFFELTDEEVKAYFTNHIMAQYTAELAQNMAGQEGRVV
jgi:hypothetical protein